MYVYLTIARYPAWLSWAGFLSMGYFRFYLYYRKNIGFYKLLGCGKNGSFSKMPDVRQWGILAVTNDAPGDEATADLQKVYGKFVTNWWRFFDCTKWTIVLQPVAGHGTWDGKKVFGNLPHHLRYRGHIAILTRATIRLNRLPHFWKHVPGITNKMASAKGLITSLGIGEVPWIKQATFSVWEDEESLEDFAYNMHEHKEVIRKTNREKWYSEQMFVRFRVVASSGSLNGINPLEGKL